MKTIKPSPSMAGMPPTSPDCPEPHPAQVNQSMEAVLRLCVEAFVCPPPCPRAHAQIGCTFSHASALTQLLAFPGSSVPAHESPCSKHLGAVKRCPAGKCSPTCQVSFPKLLSCLQTAGILPARITNSLARGRALDAALGWAGVLWSPLRCGAQAGGDSTLIRGCHSSDPHVLLPHPRRGCFRASIPRCGTAGLQFQQLESLVCWGSSSFWNWEPGAETGEHSWGTGNLEEWQVKHSWGPGNLEERQGSIPGTFGTRSRDRGAFPVLFPAVGTAHWEWRVGTKQSLGKQPPN